MSNSDKQCLRDSYFLSFLLKCLGAVASRAFNSLSLIKCSSLPIAHPEGMYKPTTEELEPSLSATNLLYSDGRAPSQQPLRKESVRVIEVGAASFVSVIKGTKRTR